jgi:hypothetical protein
MSPFAIVRRDAEVLWTAAGCGLVLLLYGWVSSVGAITHGFAAYYAAARATLKGEFGSWVFDDVVFTAYVQRLTGSNVLEIFGPNVPTMAIVALPVAWLAHDDARTAWLLLSWASLLGGVVILANHARERHARTVPLLVGAVLLSPSVLANVRTGQAYLFVFAAFAVGAHLLLRQHDSLGGLALASALVTKSSGAPWLAILVAGKQTRAVGVALGASTGLALALLPWISFDTWRTYAAYLVAFVERPSTGATAYQTTVGFVRHVCVPDAYWNPTALVSCSPRFAWAILALAVAITFAHVGRGRPSHRIAAGICLSLMLVPIAEDHHFVLLGAALFMLWPRRWRRGDWPLVAALALLWVPSAWSIHRFTDGWASLLAYPRLYALWLVWGYTVGSMRGAGSATQKVQRPVDLRAR